MKVELKHGKEKKARAYPKLMESLDSERAWLMTGDHVGTVLYAYPYDSYNIGDHCDNLDMEYLEDYEGSICLSND